MFKTCNRRKSSSKLYYRLGTERELQSLHELKPWVNPVCFFKTLKFLTGSSDKIKFEKEKIQQNLLMLY